MQIFKIIKSFGYVFEQQEEVVYHLVHCFSLFFSTHLINSFIFLGFEWDRGGDLDHIEANYQPDIASRLPNSPTRLAAILAGQQLTQKRFIFLVGGYTVKGARKF